MLGIRPVLELPIIDGALAPPPACCLTGFRRRQLVVLRGPLSLELRYPTIGEYVGSGIRGQARWPR